MSYRGPNADILAVVLLVCGALLAGVGVWQIVEEGTWTRASPIWDAANALLGIWLVARGVSLWKGRRTAA